MRSYYLRLAFCLPKKGVPRPEKGARRTTIASRPMSLFVGVRAGCYGCRFCAVIGRALESMALSFFFDAKQSAMAGHRSTSCRGSIQNKAIDPLLLLKARFFCRVFLAKSFLLRLSPSMRTRPIERFSLPAQTRCASPLSSVPRTKIATRMGDATVGEITPLALHRRYGRHVVKKN